MNRVYLIVYIVLMYSFGYWAAEHFRQERAKLDYINEKYLRNFSLLTARRSRHEPYLTNMTGTTQMPFGNNVSAGVTMMLLSGGDFRFVSRCCDSVKNKWMNKFMASFTNLTLDNCPFPANTYSYLNMELPPKFIPAPITNSDYQIKFELFITATKESILELHTTLHYEQNTKKGKRKGK